MLVGSGRISNLLVIGGSDRKFGGSGRITENRSVDISGGNMTGIWRESVSEWHHQERRENDEDADVVCHHICDIVIDLQQSEEDREISKMVYNCAQCGTVLQSLSLILGNPPATLEFAAEIRHFWSYHDFAYFRSNGGQLTQNFR